MRRNKMGDAALADMGVRGGACRTAGDEGVCGDAAAAVVRGDAADAAAAASVVSWGARGDATGGKVAALGAAAAAEAVERTTEPARLVARDPGEDADSRGAAGCLVALRGEGVTARVGRSCCAAAIKRCSCASVVANPGRCCCVKKPPSKPPSSEAASAAERAPSVVWYIAW